MSGSTGTAKAMCVICMADEAFNIEPLIDDRILKPKTAVFEKDWRLWEKKNFNIHRGVLDWPATPCLPVDALARRIREGVRNEFKPRWFRGFGFGAILHLTTAPSDFTEICKHIDRRNKENGVWQWAIVLFAEDKVALGVHTWMHGYLRPVYDSLLQQLTSAGYECHSVDSEIDPLINTLRKIRKVCRAIAGVAEIST